MAAGTAAARALMARVRAMKNFILMFWKSWVEMMFEVVGV